MAFDLADTEVQSEPHFPRTHTSAAVVNSNMLTGGADVWLRLSAEQLHRLFYTQSFLFTLLFWLMWPWKFTAGALAASDGRLVTPASRH